MAYNFYKFLLSVGESDLDNMPPIQIDERETDKRIAYNKNLTRIYRISGNVYGDETLGRIIMWANPEYDYEFSIPNGTILRVPFPKNAVLQEITRKINLQKNLG